jgi:hypothetical protein
MKSTHTVAYADGFVPQEVLLFGGTFAKISLRKPGASITGAAAKR